MKIGVDARTLAATSGSGVLAYWRHLIPPLAVAASAAGGQLYFYTDDRSWSPRVLAGEPAAWTKAVSVKVVPRRRGWFDIWLPLQMRRDGINAALMTLPRVPRFRPCPIAVVVHDLCFLEVPECYESRDLKIMAACTRHIKKADLILAVSASTAKAVVERLGVPHERVAVTLEASPLRSPRDVEASASYRRGLVGDCRYFLTVSRLDAKKNLPRVVEGFARARRNAALREKLVMVGPKNGVIERISEIVMLQGLQEAVLPFPLVSDEQLDALYRGATALVFPSLCEGFGLPILEAMARGCPVITSNRSAMQEVAGEAACFVDPLSIESIAGAMTRLASDAAYRQTLGAAGLAHSKKFSWSDAAERALAALRELA